MRKLLSLMSIFALGTTSTATVVACQQESKTDFDYKAAKTSLESGNFVFQGDLPNIDKNITPEQISETIQNGILLRLQTTIPQAEKLTTSDFTITITSLDETTTYLNKDVFNDKSNYLDVFNTLNKLKWTISATNNTTPDDPKSNVEFENSLSIRKSTDMTAEKLLSWHNDSSKPAKIFKDVDEKVTVNNFQEIFFNAYLGGPLEFNAFKGKFEVAIAPGGIQELNNLTSKEQEPVKVPLTFTVKENFTTTQSLLYFAQGDTATVTSYFILGK